MHLSLYVKERDIMTGGHMGHLEKVPLDRISLTTVVESSSVCDREHCSKNTHLHMYTQKMLLLGVVCPVIQ